MSRSYFISDLHIAGADDPKLGLFQAFLEKCFVTRPDHLFLVGDIFDFWIADRAFFTESYSDVIRKLLHLKLLGTAIHYFEGNHDLDLRLYWQQKLGFDVQDSAAYYQLGPLNVRVEHGDQMDPSDRGYLFLRWFLRTGVRRFLGRHLPDTVVRFIGRRASLASREYTTQVKVASDERVKAKIHRHSLKAFSAKPFDLFISGHVHILEDSTLEQEGRSFRCIGLGTWLKEPVVLVVNDSDVQLQQLDEFLYQK